ncbi:MAG: prepilin-type N-terminal cleavage/methylation domain-containing protein [Phycisphaerales bacterium]|nr:prepilin-type N-terminal cleavage/methylation domain-containing protein [Phycisphaerales bacterium]
MGRRRVQLGLTPVRAGFSLIELVIVIVIIGIIAAIAVPRMGKRAETARVVRLMEDMNRYQEAIERYKIEHGGRSPAHDSTGALDTSGDNFIARLTMPTDDDGALRAGGLYGPYLRAAPSNAASRLVTVRIGGAAAGADTHGWRFGPNTGLIEPDNLTTVEIKNVGDAVVSRGKVGGFEAVEDGP